MPKITVTTNGCEVMGQIDVTEWHLDKPLPKAALLREILFMIEDARVRERIEEEEKEAKNG